MNDSGNDTGGMPPFDNAPPPPQPAEPMMGVTPDGPAWEDASRPLFERFIATVKPIYTAPGAFFEAMSPTGNFGQALVFGLIGGSIGTIIAQIYNLLFQGGMMGLMGIAGGVDEHALMGQAAGNLFGGVCTILVAPVLVAIGLFIASGILHLFLMLLKGAHQPYEATFRVVAYASGALTLLNVIPFCGGMVAGIWVMVVEIIGLAAVHRCGTGKAVAAVLLPIAVCCTCAIIAFMALGGLAAFGVAAAQGAH